MFWFSVWLVLLKREVTCFPLDCEWWGHVFPLMSLPFTWIDKQTTASETGDECHPSPISAPSYNHCTIMLLLVYFLHIDSWWCWEKYYTTGLLGSFLDFNQFYLLLLVGFWDLKQGRLLRRRDTLPSVMAMSCKRSHYLQPFWLTCSSTGWLVAWFDAGK